MKKILAVFLTVALLVCAMPTGVFNLTANAAIDGYFTYTVSNGEATITDCNESISGDVTIPTTLGGYPVTSIGDSAFYNCSSLTSITIPDSVTSIGYLAFYSCFSLASIDVKNSNMSYCSEDGVLFNKDKTELIRYPEGKWDGTYTIPNGVNSIAKYAFSFNQSFSEINIPDSVVSICECAFLGCESLAYITIPNSVITIGDQAFAGCNRALESINITNSVKSIGNYAFLDCYNLKSINVDSNNSEYSSSNGILFNKNKTTVICCPAGKKANIITIPNSVTNIYDCAFYGCENIRNIVLPNCVKNIGDDAFAWCGNLISINIPNGVEFLGESAFLGCQSLSSITIPKSVTSLGRSVFERCESLGSITIPNSVTSIGEGAFYHCSSLTSITIPDSVTSIGDQAFYSCSSLTSITIPDSVTSIGYLAFYYCSSLTSVTIPDSVTSIGDSAFEDCSSLTSITIPDSVTSIGERAFIYCSSLENVYYCGTVEQWNNISISSGNVELTNATINFHKYENGVCKFCKVISEDMLTYTVSNGKSTITGCNTSISGDVEIPSTLGGYPVKSFSWGAFQGSKALTQITIPDSVTNIGMNTFAGCSSLKEVCLSDNITQIGFGLFRYCTSLTSIIIPEKVLSIENYAFEGCTSLKSLVIPASVNRICEGALKSCSNLSRIKIINPNCNIYDNADTISETATIYGYSGSTAEEYAKNYNREFIPLDLEIDSVSITAGTDITVNYYCEYGANASMRFTVNGEEFIVDGYYDAEINKYVYRFPNIAPDRLGDEIKAELITNGEVVAVKEGFTIKKYLDTILSRSAEDFGMAEEDYAKLKTLAADLLHYGAAAQKYFGYKTSELVNTDVTEGTEFVAPTTTAKDVINKSANGVTFAGQNLRFDSVNRLMFKFKVDTSVITDITKLSIKIAVGDEEKVVTSENFETAGDNSYIVYTDEIFATEFDEVFTVTACVDGVDGANVKYSVNSYVYAICNSATASEKMIELAKATYNYGLSAKAYLNK